MSFHRSRRRRAARVLTLSTVSAAALLLGTGVAFAHVTVSPSTAVAGDESTQLTFRVPTESETAGTVGVTITLPADHPFADVLVEQIAGWTVTPTKTTLPAPVTEGDITIKDAVTSVTWTAAPGTRIGPGEFGEFNISAGPVPDVDSLAFPVAQTYDDGTVVNWNEPTPASGAEPDHPVPTLTITAAAAMVSAGTGPGTDSSAPTTTAATVSAATTAAGGASDSTAIILAIIGIVVAAAALLVGAVALRRRPAGPSQQQP